MRESTNDGESKDKCSMPFMDNEPASTQNHVSNNSNLREEDTSRTPIDSSTGPCLDLENDFLSCKDILLSKTTTSSAAAAAAATTTTTTTNNNNNNNKSLGKIKVHLVAVGSAPILKKSKFLMNADDQFAVASMFLKKVLKISSSSVLPSNSSSNEVGLKTSSLFLYVNAAFVPSPDERIGDLFDCFSCRGELVIHYSFQEAWG